MPRTHCAIPRCRNGRRARSKATKNCSETDRVSFFSFPKNPLLREKWKRIVPRPNWEPYFHSRICSDHFPSNCFIWTKKVGRNWMNQKVEESSVPGQETVRYLRTLRPGSIPKKLDTVPVVASSKEMVSVKKSTLCRPPDKKIPITDLNSYLICIVCDGYFINPVTITECLHTFCRSCLVRHFFVNLKCPACKVEVHPTDPLSNVRYDTLKQDILNRLLPYVEADEEKREIAFYEERGLPRPVRQDQHKTVPLLPLPLPLPLSHREDYHAETPNRYYPKQKLVSLVLEYAGCVDLHIRVQPLVKKFVRVAACTTIAHLKKFIKLKLRSRTEIQIDVLCDNAFLEDSWDLEFVSDYFYNDDPDGIVQLHYVVSNHGLRMVVPDLFDTPTPSPGVSPPPPSPTPGAPTSPPSQGVFTPPPSRGVFTRPHRPQYDVHVISSDEDSCTIRLRIGEQTSQSRTKPETLFDKNSSSIEDRPTPIVLSDSIPEVSLDPNDTEWYPSNVATTDSTSLKHSFSNSLNQDSSAKSNNCKYNSRDSWSNHSSRIENFPGDSRGVGPSGDTMPSPAEEKSLDSAVPLFGEALLFSS